MIPFNELKITLLDIDKYMCEQWLNVLNMYNITDEGIHFPNIEVVNKGCVEWLEENNNHLLGIVAPAKSFGLMDGGFDGAIRQYFMEYYDFDCIPIVQKHLKEKFCGEQPVGSSTLVRLPVIGSYILHTPTMIRPSIIEDPRIVYHCTRACVLEALRTECDHIVMPAFGGCCGKVSKELIAEYMCAAFQTFVDEFECVTWYDVYHRHILNDLELM